MKNFKKVLTSVVTMAMMVGGLSVSSVFASVKDPNEPNDKVSKATELKPGEIVLGEIGDYDLYQKAAASDVDWYKFSTVKGKTYRLCVTGVAGRFRAKSPKNDDLDMTTLLITGYHNKKDAEEGASWRGDRIEYVMRDNKVDYYDITAKETGTYYIEFCNCINSPKVTPIETTSYTISIDGMYKDVTKISDFWYEPTYYLSALGVVKGYDKGTKFKPNNDCTRAQMVTFLWRLNGSPKPKSKKVSFTDIKSGEYYYNAVLWAVEKGITTDAKKFNPGGVCTRGMTVTFLWRMAGKPSVGKAKCKFSDVKKSDYFYEAVIWASSKKIVAGYSDGTFKPAGKCARRQMVTFLYKYDKYINGRG